MYFGTQTVPESTLKNTSNSIAYYFVREEYVINEWKTGYIYSGDKPSYILTKSVPIREKGTKKVGMIVYDVETLEV